MPNINIKLMVVPGRILDLMVPEGSTVMEACAIADTKAPEVGWAERAKGWEVRVSNQKFSNTEEFNKEAGYVGSIHTTPLTNGQVVLIMTQVKGNINVLTCKVNDVEYAMEEETPIRQVLRSLVGIDPNTVESVTVNGRAATLDQHVGNNANIVVALRRQSAPVAAPPPPSEPDENEDEDEDYDGNDTSVEIDGKEYETKLFAIRAIMKAEGMDEEIQFVVDGKVRIGKLRAIQRVIEL